MPLRDPNAVAYAPYWSRNSMLGQADINNMMYRNMQANANQASMNYQNPRRVARRPARRGGGGNFANAARIAAIQQGRAPGGMAPSYPQYPQAQGPSAIAQTYQQQHDRANAANEQRYQDILEGYNQREADALEQAKLVQDQNYREESSRIQNDLIGRGLANSSLRGKRLFDAYERNAQYPLQVQLQTSGDRLGFMERRNDVAPDINQMLQLAQMQGQTDSFRNQDIQQVLSQLGSAIDQRMGAQNAPNYANYANQLSRSQAANQMNYAMQNMAPMFQGGGYNVPNLMGLGMQTAAGRYNDLSNRGRYPAMGPYWNPGGRPGQQFAGHAGPQQGQPSGRRRGRGQYQPPNSSGGRGRVGNPYRRDPILGPNDPGYIPIEAGDRALQQHQRDLAGVNAQDRFRGWGWGLGTNGNFMPQDQRDLAGVQAQDRFRGWGWGLGTNGNFMPPNNRLLQPQSRIAGTQPTGNFNVTNGIGFTQPQYPYAPDKPASTGRVTPPSRPWATNTSRTSGQSQKPVPYYTPVPPRM